MNFGIDEIDGEDARLAKKETGGGTVLDWGVYCIQMCLLAYSGQKPENVKASAVKINENGVDLGLNVVLKFPNNGIATFNTDLRVNLPNNAVIAGTKGIITVSHLIFT